jgi:hypothetical protein
MSSNAGGYPPLLQPGFHPMTLADIHTLAVVPYEGLSVRRAMIHEGLTRFLAELSQAGISGTAWVNGSFVTQKVDPDDCDLVLCCDGVAVDAASPALRALLIKQFQTEKAQVKVNYHCDVYVLFEYPETDARHENGLRVRAYWRGQFGFDHQDQPKGLAVVTLPVSA